MTGRRGAQAGQLPLGLGGIPQAQPTLGRLDIVPVREPQLFHGQRLYGTRWATVKTKMGRILGPRCIFPENTQPHRPDD